MVSPVGLWRRWRNLAAKHERLEGLHVDDTPVETEPTDDFGNGIEITGARGLLSHLGQLHNLGLGEVQHVEAANIGVNLMALSKCVG